MPQISEVPEVPVMPDVPMVPEVPMVPKVPEVPVVPQVLEMQQVPEIPAQQNNSPPHIDDMQARRLAQEEENDESQFGRYNAFLLAGLSAGGQPTRGLTEEQTR